MTSITAAGRRLLTLGVATAVMIAGLLSHSGGTTVPFIDFQPYVA